MDITTFTLANDITVLAHPDGYPYHFMSRSQADRRAAQLRADGVNAFAYKGIGRPFYVAIEQAPNVAPSSDFTRGLPMCPGCNGHGVMTDDPQVSRCESCGGVFTPDRTMPITMQQAFRFVRMDAMMLTDAGPDGQFYFDFFIATEWKDKPEIARVHGWADTKTKRVVQFG